MSGARVLVVVGATATGKSDVALALAERLDGEIIGADSRQIYRHLDIGTAKPTPAERARVPHHLVDVVEPDEGFDAARFGREARARVEEIVARGRVPILCGGTGLYVRAAVQGLFDAAPASPALRRELCALEQDEGAGTLHALLREEDPATAARLHPNDVFRIVRALEVGRTTDRPMSAWQEAHGFRHPALDATIIGCERPRDELARRIEQRCAAMLDAGLLDEIQALWAQGFGPELPALRSVGYLEMGQRLRGELDADAASEQFVRATQRLAKRQRTWFRGQTDARWFHPDEERAAIVAMASSWAERARLAPRPASSSARQ